MTLMSMMHDSREAQHMVQRRGVDVMSNISKTAQKDANRLVFHPTPDWVDPPHAPHENLFLTTAPQRLETIERQLHSWILQPLMFLLTLRWSRTTVII